MARRRREEHHENNERWLVSYADFMTLMFAFFVVMFATARTDAAKVKEFSEAVEHALKHDQTGAQIQKILNSGKAVKASAAPKAQKLPGLESPLEELKKALHNDIEKGRVRLSMEKRGLVISLQQAAFFPTGDTTVAPGGYASLAKVAETLLKLPNPVRLEGHTDSIPISNERFSSNWHLSAARSIAMLDLLTTKFGVPAARLAVVGYGDTVAVDSNDTEAGRAHNRRVDVTVLNESSITGESRPEAVAVSQAKTQGHS